MSKRNYDSREVFIATLQEEILASGKTYNQLAKEANVSHTTIQGLACGRTKWPKYTTLFPLVKALGLKLEVTKDE